MKKNSRPNTSTRASSTPKPVTTRGAMARSNSQSDLAGISRQEFSDECRKVVREELRSTMREEMRDMMREELDAMRRQIQTDIERSLQPVIEGLQQRVRDIEEHIRGRDNSTERFRKYAAEIMSQMDPISKTVDEVAAEVRRPVLMLSGGAVPLPVEQQDQRGRNVPEDVTPVVIDVVRKILPDIPLQRDDISSCFRVGQKRKLVVKFNSSGPNTMRERLYQGRFDLMKRRNVPVQEQLWINESLSPQRQSYMTALLAAKKDGRIHSTFSRDGVVYFRPSQHEAIIKVDAPGKLRGYASLE